MMKILQLPLALQLKLKLELKKVLVRITFSKQPEWKYKL